MNVNVYRRFVVVLLINCCSLHNVLQRGASLQHLTFAILTDRAPDSIAYAVYGSISKFVK